MKDRKIKEYLSKPIKIGDEIVFSGAGNGSKDPKMKALATVKEVKGSTVLFGEKYGKQLISRDISEVEKSTRHIGENPFQPRNNYQTYRIDIGQLFWRAGIDKEGKNKMEKYFNVDIPECVLNPTVTDSQGKEVEFQRGLVWTLEQKQLLIESIYNNIEIGKFVFRKRSFSWVESRVKKGLFEGTGFSDLIDGKQRTTTLRDFVQDKFRDVHGNLFSELSGDAQRMFLGYGNLTYVEMPEDSTDNDVINQFLAINHTGKPMSKEHIEFVKSIKL